MSGELALEARKIIKNFGTNQVLKEMDFQLRKGEVHALLGINGAGKSTLIKIISGAYRQDSGQIFVDGKDMGKLTPTKAIESGIATIYQETSLFPELSVAENLSVGHRVRKGKTLDWKGTVEKARTVFNNMGISIDPYARVGSIGKANMQLVEIARSLSTDAKILIMDEPTSALSRKETDNLFEIIRRLKAQGTSIIYISHRMEEIFEIADRLTVLRDGKAVGTKDVRDAGVGWITSAMLGRASEAALKMGGHGTDEVLLEVKGLGDGGLLHDISFTVHRGEIVALGGLVGAGRSETAKAVLGLDRYTEGEVFFKGKPLKKNDFAGAIRSGIGMIPEDRAKEGLVLDMTAYDNFIMAALPQISSSAGVRNLPEENRKVKELADSLMLNPNRPDKSSRSFSGGNQQKVVIGKWLATNPELLVLDEPTCGVDVGAKFEIYKLIDQLAKEGKGILVISSDLTEVEILADKTLIMRSGTIVCELDSRADQNEMLKYSIGGEG